MRKLILFPLLIALVYIGKIHTTKPVQIDAAFSFKGDVVFMSGREYVTVGKNGYEKYDQIAISNSNVGKKIPVKAAMTVLVKKQQKVRFYLEHGVFLANTPNGRRGRFRKYSASREGFIFRGGPDAAVTRKGYNYIFKGCRYVVWRKRYSVMTKNSRNIKQYLGIPCPVDAAWGDNGATMILKGDKIYEWDRNATPILRKVQMKVRSFSTRYHLTSWQVKPNPDTRLLL